MGLIHLYLSLLARGIKVHYEREVESNKQKVVELSMYGVHPHIHMHASVQLIMKYKNKFREMVRRREKSISHRHSSFGNCELGTFGRERQKKTQKKKSVVV